MESLYNFEHEALSECALGVLGLQQVACWNGSAGCINTFRALNSRAIFSQTQLGRREEIIKYVVEFVNYATMVILLPMNFGIDWINI